MQLTDLEKNMALKDRKKLSIIKDIHVVSHRMLFLAECLVFVAIVSQLTIPSYYEALKKVDQVGEDRAKILYDLNMWDTRHTPVSSWRERDYVINGSPYHSSVLDGMHIVDIVCFSCSICPFWWMALNMLMRLRQHFALVWSKLIKKFGERRLKLYYSYKLSLWLNIVSGGLYCLILMMDQGVSTIQWIESRIYDATPLLNPQVSSIQPHPFTMGQSPPYYLYDFYRYPMEDVVYRCEYLANSHQNAVPIYKTANWRKNGVPLQIQDDRISVSVTINKVINYNDDIALYSILTILTIQMLQESDFGTYTCEYYTPLIPVVKPGASMNEKYTKTTDIKIQPMSPDPKCGCKPKLPNVDARTDHDVYVPTYQCFAEFNLIRRGEKVIQKVLDPGSILIEGYFYATVAGLDELEIEMPKQKDHEDNCCSTLVTMYWRLFSEGSWSSVRPPFTRTVITDEGYYFIRYQCMCKSNYGIRDFSINRHYVNVTTGRKNTVKIIYPMKHRLSPLYTNPISSPKTEEAPVNSQEQNFCVDSGFSGQGCEEISKLFESSLKNNSLFETSLIGLLTIVGIVLLIIIFYILNYRYMQPILSAVLYVNHQQSTFEAVNGKPLKNLKPCRRRRGQNNKGHCKEHQKYHVYLSFDEQNEYDSMLAEFVKEKLLSINISVFDFKTDVTPGFPELTEIENAIANSSRFVVLASKSYVEYKAMEFDAIQTTIVGQGSRLKDRLLIFKTEDCDIDRIYQVPCIKIPDWVKQRDALDDESVSTFRDWEKMTRPADDVIDDKTTIFSGGFFSQPRIYQALCIWLFLLYINFLHIFNFIYKKE